MPTYELELARCLIQQGRFSMSATSHRRRGGDPKLDITLGSVVTWRVYDLDQGIPLTKTGIPAADGVDIYFLVKDSDEALKLVRSFPTPTTARAQHHIRPSVDPSGLERVGGKKIRPIYPIAAFGDIDSVTVTHTSRLPHFTATATGQVLHVEYELTPVREYGSQMVELHFGIRGDYTVAPCSGLGPSQAVIEMQHSLYATIVDELLFKL